MHQLFEKNLITTKDAGELSGYTSDYLARLARSGKIAGRRIGHSWLIDSESLKRFVEEQGDRRVDYTRALARAREEEYALHQNVRKEAPLLSRTAKALPNPIPMSQFGVAQSLLRTQVFAFTIAFLVVVSGAVVARAAAVPQLAEKAADFAREVAFGFDATFGDIPSRIAARIDAASGDMRTRVASVAMQSSLSSARLASSALAEPDLSFLRLAIDCKDAACAARGTRAGFATAQSRGNTFAVATPVQFDLASFASGAAALASSPANAADALASAYGAVGEKSYGAIVSTLDAYRSLVERSGASTLALAATARDALATTPHLVADMNLALGNAVIGATHALIRADVMVAYGAASAAPASARVAVALIGGAGDMLAGATVRVPALATALFLRATAVPATLGPSIAQAIFNAEYAGATRFVAAAHAVSGQYLALVLGTGNLAYEGTTGTIALARATSSLIADAPAAFEDAYLGTLGKSALALDTLARVPKVAAVLSAVNTATAPIIAAVLPPLSIGEEIAFATYETIHDFLSSAGRSLAALFTQPSPIALSTDSKPVAATSTVQNIIVNPTYTTTSSPTYTTIVRGVSEDFVNESLARLRNQVFATVASIIKPVSNQVATNSNTIQYVNMIQDLSNLIVRNGDFRGGIFDSGIRVTATSGNFTTLTGGTTNLGATTISGALTVGDTNANGTLSVNGRISANYFTATSTTATSTFAGSLAIDTNGFVYATSTKNVGIGILSPAALLAIQNSTSTQPIFVAKNAAGTEMYRLTNAGFIGIGTSSPDAMIALQQSANGTTFISAYRITDTAPSGDFINYKTNSGTTLFRVDNSGNLLAGGIVNSGSQTITSTSTPQFRVQYDASNEWTATVGSTGTTTFAINGSAPALVFTPQSNALNTFNFTNAASNSILSVDTTNQRVGIGTTSPAWNLNLAGTRPSFALSDTSAGANLKHWLFSSMGGSLYVGTSTDAFGTSTPSALAISNSGNLGVGTASPSYKLDVVGLGRFTGLVDAANFVATSTTASQFPYASTTQLSAYGSIVVGGTATTTIAGDGNASTIYSPVTIRGTSSQASSLVLQRGLNNTNNTITFNDQVGSSLMRIYTDANTGYGRIVGDQSYLTLGTNAGGTMLTLDTTGHVNATAHILPTANQLYDLGSPALYWRNSYTNNVVANNLSSASTSIAGTNTTSFSINSNNPTSDTQDMSLIFYRGAGAPANAVFSWNSTLKRFEFNQNAYITNASASTGSTTLKVAAVSGQTAALTSWLDASGNVLSTVTAAGNFGIGTTTPGYKLDTAGFINTDQYSGYKQAGNTVLYASTTNNTLAVGASAAAAWMSASSSLMPKSIAVGPGALAATPLNSIGMNTAVGYQALSSNTAGYFNTANGAQSLFSNTTGYYNTANGEIALYYNTTGIANTASGEQALLNNVTGSYNTGIGTNASLNNISATSSVAIGFSAANGTAAYSNQGGVYLGYQSGYSAATGSDYNTLLGYQSGYGVTTGARNVLIGQATIAASYNQVTTGSNNIAIGNDVAVASPTASNQLNIGNLIYGTGLNGTGSTLSSGNVGIGTTSPSTTLSVAGNGYFTGTVGIGGMDTLLARDAANTLAQRNGTNAQSLRVYSSYTDASNYSRLSLGRDVNNTPAVIITEQAGTGTAQPLYIGTSGAAAINFITNNTVAWALDSSGNFGPNSASLTYNLGSTGTKIKDIYTGNIYASSTLQATGNIIGYASVGIGSTTPWGQLSVNPNGITGPAFVVGSSTATNFIITNAGNVGIGATPNQDEKLRIASGNIVLDTNYGVWWDSLGSYRTLRENGPTGAQIVTAAALVNRVWTGATEGFMVRNSSGTSLFEIAGDGSKAYLANNLGIGTTSPSQALSVQGNGLFSGNVYAANITATGTLAISGAITFPLAKGNFLVGNDAGISQATSTIFISSTGNVGIGTTNPQTKLDVQGTASSTTFYATNGAAGSPSYAFSSQTNTGMYWDGSSINFATAGSRRFDINAGGADVTGALTASGALTVSGASNSSFVGNVGIGTTNPGYKLDVNGTIHGYNGRLLIEQGNTGWGMFRVIPTQTNVQVDAMDSTQVTPLNLVFNPNGGNVGIGTTTPNSILNIAGATPKLTLTDTSAGANLKHWFVQSNAGALRFATTSDALADNSLAAMTITSSGGVGIGTASPGVFRLNVTGGDNNNLIGSVNPSGSSMRIQANAAANYVQGAGNVPLFIANSGANGFIAFYPNDVERVRITTGGNVGIGTTSPSQALSVQGNGLFSGNVYAANITATGTLAISGAITFPLAKGNFLVGNDAGISQATSTIFISSTGNVGIGTTTPNNKLDIYSTTKSAIGFSGADGSAYKWTVGMDVSNGGRFSIASSTALGTTDRFVIDGNGNVGIGTTTPGSLLSVQGIANFTTATSTFQSTGGINLAAGCFAIAGTCVTGSGSSNGGVVLSAVRVYSSTGTTTWSKPASLSYIIVDVYGGGGGGGGGSPSAATGSSGTQSNFTYNSITNYVSGTGGAGGGGAACTGNAAGGCIGGAGGTAAGGDVNLAGQAGGSSSVANVSLQGVGAAGGGQAGGIGGSGGAGAVGGAGSGGGGGGGSGANNAGGGGGGAGGHARRLINASALGSTESAFVATGGTGGTGTFAGGAGGNGLIVVYEYTTTGLTLGSNGSGTAGQLPFYAASGQDLIATSSIFLATSGNVGIGTTSPQTLLGLQGGIGVSSSHLYLAANGNVNIGTTTTYGGVSTNRYLDVSGESNGVGNIGLIGVGGNITSTSGFVGGFEFFNAALSTSDKRIGAILSATDGATNSGYMTFYTYNAGTQGERMRIDKAGNIGIGTTTPWGLLSVNANAIGAAPQFVVGSSTATNFIVTNAGNVGIGSASPSAKFSVDGTAASALFDINNATLGKAGMRLRSGGTTYGTFSLSGMIQGDSATDLALFAETGQAMKFYTNGSGTTRMTIATTGDVTIVGSGTTCVIGSGTGATNCTSDSRLKTNITDIGGAGALAGLAKIRGVTFNWADLSKDQSQRVGVIAQDVLQAFPQVVGTATTTFNGVLGSYYTVDYAALVSPLISGVNELNQRTSWMQNAATSTVLTVDVAGNVGIGTTTPNYKLTVAGDIAATAFVNTSTRDAKTDIAYTSASSSEAMLDQLVNLKVATYRYKIEDQSDPLRIGFIAEDVQTIAPEILAPNGKGVDIYKLATFTLSGVQALAAKLNAEHMRVTSLEARVAALESGAVSSASGSPLALSSSTLASALEGFGVLIQKGIAQFNTLVFRQLVASKDADGTSSAGSVLVLTGNTVAQVNNSLVLPSTKVFVTFNSQIAGSWWVSDKTAGSFRVVLSAPQTTDVSFDYFLVQTEGQIATSTPNVSSSTVSQSSGPDTTAPVITLLGDNPVHVSVGGIFTDPGITVADNSGNTVPYVTFVNGIEQPVSAIDTGSQTTYIITYVATDAAGNSSTITRSVIVGSTSLTTGGATATSTPSSTDTTAPVVTLTGAAAMQITVGDAFTDPGATAADDVDGSLTANIVVTGAVDTATAGLYTLTYTATDAAGNHGSVSRVVTVAAPAASTTTSTPAI